MKGTIYRIVILIAVLSAISVASITVAGQDPPKPVRAIKAQRTAPSMVTGTIRWSKTYGIIPMGPGNSQAAPSPCGQFYVAATVPSTGTAVVTTSGMTQAPDEGDYYVCKYSLKVPTGTPLYMIAGLGGTLLLPKIDETPIFLTDAWIGGSYNKPPRGAFRTFTGSQSVNLNPSKPSAVVNFEMTYARKDNPK